MNAQRLLLVASLALAVAIGGAWLLIARGGGASAASAAEVAATPDRTPDGDRSTSGSGEPATARTLAEAATATEEAATKTAAESLPEGEGIEVLVVDKKTDQPIAGAQVQWCSQTEAEAEEESWWSWLRASKLDDVLAANGRTFTTDAEGKTRVPNVAHSGVVAARTGDKWGCKGIDEDSEPPIRIALATDRDLSVRVLDEAGRPVGGVDVALRNRWDGEGFWDAVRAETQSPDGIAVLRHARSQLETGAGYRSQVVALAVVLAKPVEVEIDRDELPAEPITLVLPATGECEVRVVDEDGAPFTEPVEVSLRTRKGDEAAEAAIERWTFAGLTQDRVRGSAVFRHVEPGRDLVATVERAGSQAQHHAQGPGPRAPGERATLTVRLGADAAILAGRVLDEKGEPVRGTKLRASTACRTPGESNSEEDYFWGFESDAEGRFEVDAPTRTQDEGSCELTVFTFEKSGEQIASATRPLPVDVGAGRHELGDFVLAPAPLLASGTVVDAAGQPVRKAEVSPSKKQIWGDGEDNYWWQPMWGLRGRTDDQGRFTLRGRLDGDVIGLAAVGRDGKLKGPAEIVAPGTTGVVLRLSDTGSIAGTVLVDEGLDRRAITLQAERQGGSNREPGDNFWMGANIDADGAFEIKGLRPGTYEVTLRIGENWNDLHRVPDVEVEGGKTSRAPSLNPLDLRGTKKALELTIVDLEGNPISQGNVIAREHGATDPNDRQWLWFNGGRMTVTYSTAAVDLDVSSPGYLSAHLARVTDDQTVVLRKAPRVRLVLASGLRPPSGVDLIAQLEGVEGGGESLWWGEEQAAFDAGGQVTTTSPAIGVVKIELMFSFHDEHAWTISNFDDEAERLIEVRDLPGEQTFEVSFDQAKLDEAASAFAKGIEEDG